MLMADVTVLPAEREVGIEGSWKGTVVEISGLQRAPRERISKGRSLLASVRAGVEDGVRATCRMTEL
jgi:hypothetical protein